MEIAAIGVGGAGGRVVDRLARELGAGGGSPLETVHAIDTDTASLDTLGTIPSENRHTIGQFETGGDGTDGDREQAAEIIENERTEIRRAVEDDIPTTVDAIVIAAGLAGGTGSAVTPALVAGLARIYEQPVYTVSILPTADETDERRRANTARALTSLGESATAQIAFDNEAWLRDGQRLEDHGDTINAELAERLGELFSISQDGGGAVGERVVDTRDVMGTLDGGNVVSLGYAGREIAKWRGANSSLLDGLKRRVLGDDTDEYERGRALQRTLAWATRGTMTFECPQDVATHGLVVFRGPPGWLRGNVISKGRKWLADWAEIERLRSGDVPSSGTSSLDVLVVLAGIERAPRIEAFSGKPAEPADDGADGEDGDPPEDRASEKTEDIGSDATEANTESALNEDDPSGWGVPPGESGEGNDSARQMTAEDQPTDESEASGVNTDETETDDGHHISEETETVASETEEEEGFSEDKAESEIGSDETEMKGEKSNEETASTGSENGSQEGD
jgi:cell division GTPase FtsZ